MSCQYKDICKTFGRPSVDCWLYQRIKTQTDTGGDDTPHPKHILKISGPYWSKQRWEQLIKDQLRPLFLSFCYEGMVDLLTQLTKEKAEKGEIY